MAKFVFIYHGGLKPESKAEFAHLMEAWENRVSRMGPILLTPAVELACPGRL